MGRRWVLALFMLAGTACGGSEREPVAGAAGRGNEAGNGTSAGGAEKTESGGRGNAGSPTDPAMNASGMSASGGADSGEGGSPAAWNLLAPLGGGPRQETGVAALGRKLYVVGGLTPTEKAVATVEVYDTSTLAWSVAEPLPKVMHHANTAAVGGKLYVVGALDGSFAAMGDVYVYDPLEGWAAKSPLPPGTERGASAVAVVGSVIYVAGGHRGAHVADFSAYDTKSDTHVLLPPMLAARDHLVGSAVGNVVYAIGGRSGGFSNFYGKVDAYDIASMAWAAVADVKTPRAGAAAAVVGDRIVVAGGEGSVDQPKGVFRQTEAFSPANNDWITLPDMDTPRHGTGAAVIDGVFYVPGGATTQAYGATDTVEALTF